MKHKLTALPVALLAVATGAFQSTPSQLLRPAQAYLPRSRYRHGSAANRLTRGLRRPVFVGSSSVEAPCSHGHCPGAFRPTLKSSGPHNVRVGLEPCSHGGEGAAEQFLLSCC
jgi:hypothetical protein